jgi:E3 ubiquitin-protein ligase HECTD1
VAWDAGGTNSYRMGAEGKYDLMLAPSHDPDKLRKDPLSPRPTDTGKAKVQSADSSDSKNKVITYRRASFCCIRL